MARPKGEVHLSFEEDTVRLRREAYFGPDLTIDWVSDRTVIGWNLWSSGSPIFTWGFLAEDAEIQPYEYVYWCPPHVRYDEEQRALELLLECLTPSQKEEFNYRKSFTVISPSNRTYRIEWGKNYNVKLLDENGRSISSYCAAPLEDIPIPDVMLSQKLMLENDEHRFLRLANVEGDMLTSYRGLEELITTGAVDELSRIL